MSASRAPTFTKTAMRRHLLQDRLGLRAFPAEVASFAFHDCGPNTISPNKSIGIPLSTDYCFLFVPCLHFEMNGDQLSGFTFEKSSSKPASINEGDPLAAPGSPVNSIDSDKDLIFERMVQDPLTESPVLQCPRCGNHTSKCHHNSILKLPQHFNTENFIPAALDSTTSLINSQEDMDLDLSTPPRRPSVVSLSQAFPNSYDGTGPTSSVNLSAGGPIVRTSPSSPALSRNQSFCSYADMIKREDQEGNVHRRPSIQQTLSGRKLPALLRRSTTTSVGSDEQLSLDGTLSLRRKVIRS